MKIRFTFDVRSKTVSLDALEKELQKIARKTADYQNSDISISFDWDDALSVDIYADDLSHIQNTKAALVQMLETVFNAVT